MISPQFGIQTHCPHLGIQSHRSHSSVQSHRFFVVWRSRPWFQFNIQGHYIFFNLTFRVAFSFWCSESSFVSSLAIRAIIPFLHFGVQNRCLSLVWRSEPHVHSDVQSRYSFSVWRIEPLFHFGIQSHRIFSLALHGFALILIFLTSLPRAYRLFVIALPNFSFHCS